MRFLKDDQLWPRFSAIWNFIILRCVCYDTRQSLSSLTFIVINESLYPGFVRPLSREKERKEDDGRGFGYPLVAS